MSEKVTRTYERFPLARRIEHLVMLLSFTTLALTGLPQKFPGASLSIAFVYILGGIENLRKIHHFAAIVLMLGTAWHILVFGYLGYVRRTRFTMLPSLQDLKDAWQAFMYNIGRAKTPPQMGRYTFEEKMEYWAFVWGTIIMGATGLVVWFKVAFTLFLPRWIVDVAVTIHYYEAILACLAIVVWHFYHVIFDPDVYPLNWACWKGKVSEHWQQEEHPLDNPARVKGLQAESTEDMEAPLPH